MSTSRSDGPAHRRKILFTDWRDVDCGSVAWLTADCDPLAGDHAGKTVTWCGGEADVGGPADRPVSLHVTLRSAELFSITFE